MQACHLQSTRGAAKKSGSQGPPPRTSKPKPPQAPPSSSALENGTQCQIEVHLRRYALQMFSTRKPYLDEDQIKTQALASRLLSWKRALSLLRHTARRMPSELPDCRTLLSNLLCDVVLLQYCFTPTCVASCRLCQGSSEGHHQF